METLLEICNVLVAFALFSPRYTAGAVKLSFSQVLFSV